MSTHHQIKTKVTKLAASQDSDMRLKEYKKNHSFLKLVLFPGDVKDNMVTISFLSRKKRAFFKESE